MSSEEIRRYLSLMENPLGAVPFPYRIEYPYGLPGDTFRRNAPAGKSTAVVYYEAVDPKLIARVVRQGNELRYDPAEIATDMSVNGYTEPTPILVYAKPDNDVYIAEGNHRIKAAIAAGLPAVPLTIKYFGNADEHYHVFDYDYKDPSIRVISD